jgi:hypothetical protein
MGAAGLFLSGFCSTLTLLFFLSGFHFVRLRPHCDPGRTMGFSQDPLTQEIWFIVVWFR